MFFFLPSSLSLIDLGFSNLDSWTLKRCLNRWLLKYIHCSSSFSILGFFDQFLWFSIVQKFMMIQGMCNVWLFSLDFSIIRYWFSHFIRVVMVVVLSSHYFCNNNPKTMLYEVQNVSIHKLHGFTRNLNFCFSTL